MYCIFAKDAIKKMNGVRGKMASMAGHAYLHSWWDAEEKGWENRYKRPSPAVKYRISNLAFKITLAVETTEELFQLYNEIKDTDIGCSLVTDAGRTVFGEPTTVCLGVGPVNEEDVPESIRNLKVLI
jgi:peptidyl-tRNA hydrolase